MAQMVDDAELVGVDNSVLEVFEQQVRRSKAEMEIQAAESARQMDIELLRLRLIEAEYRGYRAAAELLRAP